MEITAAELEAGLWYRLDSYGVQISEHKVAIVDPELLVLSEIMEVETGDTPWEPIFYRRG